jgi:hypothetical protein
MKALSSMWPVRQIFDWKHEAVFRILVLEITAWHYVEYREMGVDFVPSQRGTTTMRKQYWIVMKWAVVAMSFLVAYRVTAGSLNPTNAPGSTMHTLEEIYQKLAAVHADMTTSVFRSTVIVSTIPKTGATNSFFPGDDGFYQGGFAGPIPRFITGTDNNSNCVTDRLTGLMWLKNPIVTPRNWTNAINYCEALDGTEGRGGFSDWRLPNFRELLSLIDARYINPALPNTFGAAQLTDDDPFVGIQSDAYWSSTTFAGGVDNARIVNIGSGLMNCDYKTLGRYVWPVRGVGSVSYDGAVNVTSTSRVNISGETIGTGDGSSTVYSGSLTHSSVVSGSLQITAGGYSFSDAGSGVLNGSVSGTAGTVNYGNGGWAINLNGGSIASGVPIIASYCVVVSNGTVVGQFIVSDENKGSISGTAFSGQCSMSPVKAGSFRLNISGGADGQFTDNGSGALSGSFNIGGGTMQAASGTLNYNNGGYAINLGILGSTVVGKTVTITYTVLTSL